MDTDPVREHGNDRRFSICIKQKLKNRKAWRHNHGQGRAKNRKRYKRCQKYIETR